ncbi:MAG: endonuclease III [Deltaproteobacteria bacterium]|nr:endonuclease III [Deltaproteobacteria bacterium]
MPRLPSRTHPRRKRTRAPRRPVRRVWPPAPARMQAILRELDRLYPAADCELDRKNPFQLLCATILSAQCTDERVNMVTPALFARFPTPAALAEAPRPVLEDMIRSTGFFRNKAKSLLGAARMLADKWAGEVPRSMDELLELPGVARKTANVVLGTAYGIPAGVVVDTHVTRLAQRLGLTRETTPEKIERDLMSIVPRERWILFSHQLIWHGRRVCAARQPDCDVCPLAPHCPSAFG